MPRPAPHIAVPAVIRKSDIDGTVGLMGKRNATGMSLDGKSFIPGELSYLGFAGALDLADGLYHGEHRYQPSPRPDDKAERADLTVLPLAPTPVVNKPKQKGAADVVQP